MESAKAFSSLTLAILIQSGWSPHRSINIDAWVEELRLQGFELSEIAGSALRSFGGLEINPSNENGPNFQNDATLVVDPILAGSGHRVLADELEEELGGSWYPLGEWMSGSSVFIDRSGWTVATGLEWIWELGTSLEDAIEFVVRAHRPLVCLRVLQPGAQPWPPNS